MQSATVLWHVVDLWERRQKRVLHCKNNEEVLHGKSFFSYTGKNTLWTMQSPCSMYRDETNVLIWLIEHCFGAKIHWPVIPMFCIPASRFCSVSSKSASSDAPSREETASLERNQNEKKKNVWWRKKSLNLQSNFVMFFFVLLFEATLWSNLFNGKIFSQFWGIYSPYRDDRGLTFSFVSRDNLSLVSSQRQVIVVCNSSKRRMPSSLLATLSKITKFIFQKGGNHLWEAKMSAIHSSKNMVKNLRNLRNTVEFQS